MGLRRRSREIVLQLLFQSEFAPQKTAAEQFAHFIEDFSVEKDTLEYARVLAEGVSQHRPEIDALIQRHSAHWKLARMALVDLNVMRIAVFEICFLKPPLQPKVAMDEAIEIAKHYGSTDSGAFVNGILDQVARVGK